MRITPSFELHGLGLDQDGVELQDFGAGWLRFRVPSRTVVRGMQAQLLAGSTTGTLDGRLIRLQATDAGQLPDGSIVATCDFALLDSAASE